MDVKKTAVKTQKQATTIQAKEQSSTAKAHTEHMKLVTETEKAGSIKSAKLADEGKRLANISKSNGEDRKKIEAAKKVAKTEIEAAEASVEADAKR